MTNPNPTAAASEFEVRGDLHLSTLPAAVVLLLFSALLALSPTAAEARPYSHAFLTSFGAESNPSPTPPDPYPLSNPTGVAVDNSDGPSAHEVYVTDPANHRVEKFTPAGEFLLMFGKEVNKTALETPGSTEAEQNVCTEASGDDCQPGSEGSAPGAFEVPTYVSVDGSSGDVYVGDSGDATISKFTESGALLASWASGGQLTRSSVGGIATDPTGKLFVLDGQWVDIFDQAGALIGEEFDHRLHPTFGIAVNAEDIVFFGAENEHDFAPAIDPSTNDLYFLEEGTHVGHYPSECDYSCREDSFGSGDLTAAQGIAVDGVSGPGTGPVYVADTGDHHVDKFIPFYAPRLTLTSPSEITSTAVTLDGRVEPTEEEVSVCYFEYGYTTAYELGDVPCEPAPDPPFSATTEVHANLTGLTPGDKYYYRLIAGDKYGTAPSESENLTTYQAPTIELFSSEDVTATTANLAASINPNGGNTAYRFEYGTTTAYGQSTPQVAIGHGTALVKEVAHLTNLQVGATYHFRVVAENQYGTVASEDQTFGFYPPSCPNESLRQQTGSANLPDCRAYELVSPANAGDATVTPAGPSSGQATSPPRIAFTTGFGTVPGAGMPSNSFGDLYVATRTPTGWESTYLGLPSDQAYASGGPPWAEEYGILGPDHWQQGVLVNPSLSKVVDWNDGHAPWPGGYTAQGEGTGSTNAPYVWDATTGDLLERWPTDLASVKHAEEFKGRTAASADLTHFVFSSNVQFAPHEPSGSVYDDNVVTGAVQPVSILENGPVIGSAPLKVSPDGSRILLSKGPGGSEGGLCPGPRQAAPSCEPGALYMRVDDAATYQVSLGHEVSYLGMTSDGSKVYFASSEELIPGEETDTNTELYMWEAQKAEMGEQPLTLISKPNGGADDTVNCNAPWTEKCNVGPISFTGLATADGGLGGNGRSDSYIASDNGDIYFYSPLQLDGGRGVPGAQNLYDYRHGSVQFVATLSSADFCVVSNGEVVCSEGPVARMDVSPDDDHMAFITTSRLTTYENAGYSEMYSYTPATGRLVCDSCVPDGEPPTSNVYGAQNGLFMTDEGRTFFSTSDALVPQDTNHAEDVYEYAEGRPRLISTGTGAGDENEETGVGILDRPGLVGVSANGTDVYFATYDVLVGQDENGGHLKIYDARVDGGFPYAPPLPGCPSADECHGAGSSPPPTPTDGAGANLENAGNAHSTHPRHPKHKRRKRARHNRGRQRHARGGAR